MQLLGHYGSINNEFIVDGEKKSARWNSSFLDIAFEQKDERYDKFSSLVLVPMLTPVFSDSLSFHVLISFEILIFIRLCAKSIYYRRKC